MFELFSYFGYRDDSSSYKQLCTHFCVDIRFRCGVYITSNRIAGSHSNPMFNFLRNFHTYCTILHLHLPCLYFKKK